jgi:hypothetical protein
MAFRIDTLTVFDKLADFGWEGEVQVLDITDERGPRVTKPAK